MKSESVNRSGKIFYGWWIVVVAWTGLFLCYISVISFTFGVFSNSLNLAFGWSRTEISLAFSLSLIAMCLAMPVVGKLVDRFGARKVIVPCALMLGLCLISLYFLSHKLWQFYTLYILMGVMGGGSSTMPYSSVVSRWFDKKRGFALALAAAGAGFGSLALPPLANALITRMGWRMAYVLLGLMVMAVTIPVGLFFKETPQMKGLLPDGDWVTDDDVEKRTTQAPGMSTREALGTKTFWIMCTAFLLIAASVIGCLIHLVPMLTDRGVTAQQAALATAALGGASLLGGVGSGYLFDRFFASYVALCFFAGAGLGLFLLWSSAVGNSIYLAAFLVGMGMGAAGQIIPYLVSRYFGLRSFGEIYSYILISFTLGGVIGPLLMGVGYDSTGSYRLVLGALILASLAAAAMMTSLGPYREWQTAVEPATIAPTLAKS